MLLNSRVENGNLLCRPYEFNEIQQIIMKNLDTFIVLKLNTQTIIDVY